MYVCYVMLCYVMLCYVCMYVMLCYIMSCYVMLCYVMVWYGMVWMYVCMYVCMYVYILFSQHIIRYSHESTLTCYCPRRSRSFSNPPASKSLRKRPGLERLRCFPKADVFAQTGRCEHAFGTGSGRQVGGPLSWLFLKILMQKIVT